MTVVVPADCSKSTSYRCVIERFGSVFVSIWLRIVCRLGVLVIRMRQISSLFSSFYVRNAVHKIKISYVDDVRINHGWSLFFTLIQILWEIIELFRNYDFQPVFHIFSWLYFVFHSKYRLKHGSNLPHGNYIRHACPMFCEFPFVQIQFFFLNSTNLFRWIQWIYVRVHINRVFITFRYPGYKVKVKWKTCF